MDDSTPRVTLRGEFLRAERHLARAVEAESQVARLTALADRLADRLARVGALADSAEDFDEIGEGWVSVRALRAALDGTEHDPTRKGGPPVPGKDYPSCLPSLGEPCGNCHRCTSPETS